MMIAPPSLAPSSIDKAASGAAAIISSTFGFKVDSRCWKQHILGSLLPPSRPPKVPIASAAAAAATTSNAVVIRAGKRTTVRSAAAFGTPETTVANGGGEASLSEGGYYKLSWEGFQFLVASAVAADASSPSPDECVSCNVPRRGGGGISHNLSVNFSLIIRRGSRRAVPSLIRRA